MTYALQTTYDSITRRQTRRTFVAGCVCSVLGFGALLSRSAHGSPDHRIAHDDWQSWSFFENRDVASRVGRAYLETASDGLKKAKMLESHLRTLSPLERLEWLRGRRENDFEQERVIFLGGWLVSETEAQLAIIHTRVSSVL